MNEPKVSTYFVSEKIAKIRWVPEQLKDAERFVTGSWDMASNFVRLWRFHRNQYADDFNDFVPKSHDKIAFAGDITGLEFVTNELLAVSCADGYITLLRVQRGVEEDVLKQTARSKLLHKYTDSQQPAACTALSVYGRELASVGEDGFLHILDCNTCSVPSCSIEADSISLHAVAFVNHQEVLTANRMGIIRMFDVRANADKTPAISFIASCEDEKRSNYVSCLTSYPTQAHIVLAGSEEGSITVWDLRQPGYPASYLSAHSSAITEINFHRTDPSKLFTGADAGELWLWAQQPLMSMPNQLDPQVNENNNPWLNGERTKNRITVTSLISQLRKPLNSFDSQAARLICGADTEAVYLIDNIF